MAKTYPDNTLAATLMDAGANVPSLWLVRGPKGTGIAWMECLAVNHRLVIVQTFKGGGWTALVDTGSIKVADTVTEVLRLCAKLEG